MTVKKHEPCPTGKMSIRSEPSEPREFSKPNKQDLINAVELGDLERVNRLVNLAKLNVHRRLDSKGKTPLHSLGGKDGQSRSCSVAA